MLVLRLLVCTFVAKYNCITNQKQKSYEKDSICFDSYILYVFLFR